MDISFVALSLSWLAGVLTTLSPCVLPLLPIVCASAMNQSRWGLALLAIGMALAFTVTGVLIASLGLTLGLNGQVLRYSAALLMLLIAFWLLNARAQAWMSQKTTLLTRHGQTWLSQFSPQAVSGQLVVGLLLGLIWTPCIGPTLGSAIALASQGQNLFSVSVVMMVFSLGAVVPLIIIGLLSRQYFVSQRKSLSMIGNRGRLVMGWSLAAVGVLVLSGRDKLLETWLIAISPDWLINLTTQF